MENKFCPRCNCAESLHETSATARTEKDCDRAVKQARALMRVGEAYAAVGRR